MCKLIQIYQLFNQLEKKNGRLLLPLPTPHPQIWESIHLHQPYWLPQLYWQHITVHTLLCINPVLGLADFFFSESWPFKKEPIGCPETSVRSHHYSLGNNPEERNSQLLRGGSRKLRKPYFLVANRKMNWICDKLTFTRHVLQYPLNEDGGLACSVLILRSNLWLRIRNCVLSSGRSCKCVMNFGAEILLRSLSRHRRLWGNIRTDVGWMQLARDGWQMWAILNKEIIRVIWDLLSYKYV